jgi:hypothetical protein
MWNIYLWNMLTLLRQVLLRPECPAAIRNTQLLNRVVPYRVTLDYIKVLVNKILKMFAFCLKILFFLRERMQIAISWKVIFWVPTVP